MNAALIARETKVNRDVSFEILHYLKNYGVSSLAYSSLQEDVKTFILPGIGYIAYTTVGAGTAVVLSDPICAPERKMELVKVFARSFPNPVFIHISRNTGRVLNELGYNVNEIGRETIIDPRSFCLKGSKKEFLRSQRNRAKKDMVSVVELSAADADMEEIKRLSESWIHTKTTNHNELSFLVRPAMFDDEMDVRKFYAKKDGRIIGFVWFDPIYRDEKIIGYMANILRSMAHVAYSVNDFIILEALEVFKREGIEQLSLGYSPFFEVEDCGEFKYSKLQLAAFKEIFEHCNHVYAFKALAFHKRMYRPGIDGTHEEKIYCASKNRVPFLVIVGIFRKIGLHPGEQTLYFAIHRIKEFLHHSRGSLINAFDGIYKRFFWTDAQKGPDSAFSEAVLQNEEVCCDRHRQIKK